MAKPWVKGPLLGKGSYGAVYLGIPTKLDFPLIAIKSSVFPFSCSLIEETKILRELQGCDGIVSLFGYQVGFENGVTVHNLLLEFAPYGSLSDLIKKNDGKLAEVDARRYAGMLLKGLRHMHERGFVHCDLKPDNILVFPDQESHYRLKISDFGLTKKMGKDDDYGCNLPGTPLYMSPEAVTNGDHEPSLDIWSLGCIVIEMLTGKPAWSCKNLATLLLQISFIQDGPKIPENISEAGKDFLKRCFERDHRFRWTADMLLRHPFITGVGFGLRLSNSHLDFIDWSYCPGPHCALLPGVRLPHEIFQFHADPFFCS